MPEVQRFPYVEVDPSLGAASALPYAPITLEREGKAANIPAIKPLRGSFDRDPFASR